jgi:hypothetical protein
MGVKENERAMSVSSFIGSQEKGRRENDLGLDSEEWWSSRDAGPCCPLVG